MLQVEKKKGESFESMFRRFNRKMQLSGRKYQVGKKRFFASKPTKNKRKASTLRGQMVAKKRGYLIRVGRLIEKPRRGRRR